MTIDEAIKHCLEVAEQAEKKVEYRPRMDFYDEIESRSDCLECATEHRQFAEWLTELKELREQNAELKSILNAALKDIHSKNIFEVMNVCKLCAMKFQQLYDIFPWQYANEALKLIEEERNGS